MIVKKDPVVQRRRLRVALREARQDRAQTQKEVAAALDWSPSKLLRVESGEVHISLTDLQALLNYYGVDDQERVDELMEMARIAKTQPWSHYKDVLSPDFVRYLGYEHAASVVCSFQPLLMPGQLQTQEYARAVIRSLSPSDDSDEIVERRIAARMERQKLLTADDAPRMKFIVDEAVLHRCVGGRQVMAQQLRHLQQASELPNVHIQILPFGAGEHPAMMGSFVVLEFPDSSDDDILYLENADGDLVVREGQKNVASYIDTFFKLEELATPSERLREVIDRVLAKGHGG